MILKAVKYLLKKISSHTLIYTAILLLHSPLLAQKNNLSLTGKTLVSSEQTNHPSEFAIDGNDKTAWESQNLTDPKWLQVVLPGVTNIKMVVLSMETHANGPIRNFAIQSYLNGTWGDFYSAKDNHDVIVNIDLKKALLTDRIRLSFENIESVKVNEFEIYGQEYIDSTVTPIKKILINQSGYNLGKSKRFTTPNTVENTPFSIKSHTTNEEVFQGEIKGQIGDFTAFNPKSNDEFEIVVDTLTSYPFRISPYWLERVTYENMVRFMEGARHYVGTTKKIRSHSWAWRDGDFYNWALQSLVAQYLSNPDAYKRMQKKITYVANASFPEAYKDKWGALEPYTDDAPDIVKLIHWDVDVKLSQNLEHEIQKAELAHFLHAYPYLKEWLPQQNFDLVYEYLNSKWEKEDVAKMSTTNYDTSESHNLLSLKTKIGTTKGELPPGHSVIPNLMMYEVSKSKGDKKAIKYFDAAYQQMEWMIENLDWEDPITTKGQRMSEHITLRAFAYFFHQYQDKTPKGLREKVRDWAKVAVRRSKNLWDFRKYTDDGDWIPAGWNETGNVLGFPACALAAKSVLKDSILRMELDRLVWSHFDNSFGRNPTGRHFSYDGPTQIEGVELGWYNEYKGGIGLLEDVPFVFDGSPKTNHYPNHPEIGNLGWTEGWVQFNTAFNLSMAYLAHEETELAITQSGKKTLDIRLRAALNFKEEIIDKVAVMLFASNGDSLKVCLSEEGPFSKYLSGTVRFKNGRVKLMDEILQARKKDEISVSYGLGYFKKETVIILK